MEFQSMTNEEARRIVQDAPVSSAGPGPGVGALKNRRRRRSSGLRLPAKAHQEGEGAGGKTQSGSGRSLLVFFGLVAAGVIFALVVGLALRGGTQTPVVKNKKEVVAKPGAIHKADHFDKKSAGSKNGAPSTHAKPAFEKPNGIEVAEPPIDTKVPEDTPDKNSSNTISKPVITQPAPASAMRVRLVR